MPRPSQPGQRYVPGLDGLRALAVLLVVAYHLHLPQVPGGLLGVGVFFTLSGYLITDLLLGEWDRSGRLRLAGFWLRRARRLLPAVFVLLVVVAAWVMLFDRSRVADLSGDIAAASGYVSNWWLIFHQVSYFAQFGPPRPLGHLWSLAVEEQFYLVWPWLLLLGVHVVRGRYRMAGGTVALAAASAAAMAVLYHPGFDPTRVYDGTDTRAGGLLIGAAAAMLWPSRRLSPAVPRRTGNLLDGVGVAGLLVIAVLAATTTQYSPFLFRGGLVVLSVATAAVVAVVAHPASRLGRTLGWSPLRWLGVRSYGIYLWHVPVIVLTTPALQRGVNVPVAGAQVAVSIGLAALSWRFVEEPIRQGALGRLWAHLRSCRRRLWAFPARAWAVAGTGIAGLAVLGLAVSGATPPATTTAAATGALGPAGQSYRSSLSSGKPKNKNLARHSRRMSSCPAVAHIGDSTSVGMISPNYLPDPSKRLTAQYRRVGATSQQLDISGARSIVETLPGQTNAQDVATQLVGQGFHGCWVLAIGGNDTADVQAGSTISLPTRITRMMSTIGNQPVLWVNVKTLRSDGPYSQVNMQLWNKALLQACPRYPNMRVYDWASAANDSWFISDGVHYTSAGYAARSRMIADALAKAFPTGHGANPSCLVH